MIRSEVFQTNNAETFEGFTGIANVVSARQDEEVWLEVHSHRDCKQLEDVIARIKDDERDGPLFRQFMDLIIPGSSCIMGDFSRSRD